MTKKKQLIVVVGMSGGVDSSLTAALLKEQGYFVIGVYMKNWSDPIKGVEHCPWITDQLDARKVANQLEIPFYTVNFESEYKKQVIDSFLADYAAGRTPNPDVLCNRFIKFDAFFRYARSLGADYIATGHYARIKNNQLLKGIDPTKDQSYFLWAIEPNVLPYILFPLGELTKKEVRVMAAVRGLTTAKKKDSQGICFIGQADVRDFLSRYLTKRPGVILTTDGIPLGQHQGVWLYTIGQRVGVSDIGWVDMAHRPTLYVKSLDVKKNTVTVAPDPELYGDHLEARDTRWFGPSLPEGTMVTAKIRYGHADVACVIVNQDESHLTLGFLKPERAITPGQSVVVYDGDTVLGGGIITSSRKSATMKLKESRVLSYSNKI
jgi:tRNA-specific 2-thiouridylase